MAVVGAPISKRRHQISRRRKLLFGTVTVGLAIFLLEIVCRIGVPAFMGDGYGKAMFLIEQEDLAADGRGSDNSREVLHPYFGWTYDPDTDPGTEAAGTRYSVNNHGFFGPSPLTNRQPGLINIAVLGGSFAHEFAMTSGQKLVSQLQESGQFSGKEVQVINIALPGFKQPQQLMVLNYMLARGAEYDYVINLDGFNEGVLPGTDNVQGGISIGHPYRWQARLEDVVDPQLTSVSYRLAEYRAKRQILANQILNSPLRGSYLRQLVWKLRDNALKLGVLKLTEEILNKKLQEGRQFAVTGPRKEYVDDETVRQEMVSLWFHSSWQMQVLCDGYGTRYLHCLQPNQYLPDSKTVFSEWETENALVDESHEFRQAVINSYPLLRQRGQELAARKVQFVDLTQVFKDELETTYRDWCCHANQRGYDLVAEAIAREILVASALGKRQQSTE